MRRTWLPAFLILLPSLVVAQPEAPDEPERPKPTAPQKGEAKQGDEVPLPRTKNARKIRSLIRDLGSDDWGTREAAREGLLDVGREALPYLERATRNKDTERRTRAKELLTTMRWLVPEELKRVVGEALDGFPSLPRQQRLAALRVFTQRPHEARIGIAFLVTIARFDPDSEVRQTAVRVYIRVSGGATPRHDGAVLSALADEKPSAVVSYLRAQLYQRMRKTAKATAAAEAALKAAPSSPQVQVLLIELYLEANQAKKALPLASKAAERAPTDLLVQIRYGEVLVRAGEREEGLARLAAILEMTKPDDQGKPTLPSLPILLRLGRAYLRCEEPEEATQVYKKALGRFPFNRQLNVAMGDVYRTQGKLSDAVRVYLSEIRYAALEPPSPEFLELRARLSEILEAGGAGWLAEQDSFFEDAHRGRSVVAVRRAVGAWLRRRGLLREAIEEQRAVTALASGSAIAWSELGEILKDARDYEEATKAFERAKGLDPKNASYDAQLKDLATLATEGRAPGSTSTPSGFALWETRFDHRTLASSAKSVTDFAPPPLVMGDVLVVPAPGVVDLFGLAGEDGRTLWRFVPEPPPRREGELPEQLGLEPVGLIAVSSGVVAATDPSRARNPAPIVVVFYNAFWRPVHRSWKKAKFRGLYAYLLDPKDGRSLGRRELDRLAQVLPPSITGRGARALSFVSRRRNRKEIQLLDLVVGKARWRAAVPNVEMVRPVFSGDRIFVGWREGVAALNLEGKPIWTHERKGVPQPEDEGDEDPVAPAGLTTGLAVVESGVVFGTTDGRLVHLARADGAATEWGRPTEKRLVGNPAVGAGRIYVAARGGAVYGLAIPEGESPAKVAWTHPGPRAALRTLTWAGGRLFALNGSGLDFFRREVAILQALDPETGAVTFQRPVARPATLVSDGKVVVVSSGGSFSRGGLRVLGAHPEEAIDAASVELLELRAAAADALVDGQFEVAAIVARKYLRRVGYETLDSDGLEFLARILARSNRREEALDVIHRAEDRAGVKGQPRWDRVRRSLGLEDEPEEGEDPEPGAKPKPGAKPADGGKPGAKPLDGGKPKPARKLPRPPKKPDASGTKLPRDPKPSEGG